MKRILIVESDEKLAARLFHALSTAGEYSVSVAPTLREASLIVARHLQDLLFAPFERHEEIVTTLRDLQPDLRAVVLAPASDVEVVPSLRDSVLAIIPRPQLLSALDSVLASAFRPVDHDTIISPRLAPTMVSTPGEPAIQAALDRFQMAAPMLMVLVSQGEAVLGHTGELPATHAAVIARRVAGTWQPSLTAQMQFVHLPSRPGDLVLYTHSVAGGEEQLLLTLVAQPGMAPGDLRRQANTVLALLEGVGNKIARPQSAPTLVADGSFAAQQTLQDSLPGNRSFAIAWRPRRPLPPMLHIPLRRGLERIAGANRCTLTHLEVRSNLVHIVVTVPEGRNSAWAAYLFKHDAEREIQTQFQGGASLWDRGYYATESREPLTEAELNLFLNPDSRG